MKRLSFRLFEIVPLVGLVAEGVPELNGELAKPSSGYRERNFSDYRTLWLTDSEILCGYRFVRGVLMNC